VLNSNSRPIPKTPKPLCNNQYYINLNIITFHFKFFYFREFDLPNIY